MEILVLLIKEAVVEVFSRLAVSVEPGLYGLSTPNQWLRAAVGRVKNELVQLGMRRMVARTTTHFTSGPCNPQGCILKEETHSPRCLPSKPFPTITADQDTQTPAKVDEHGFSIDLAIYAGSNENGKRTM